jgi:hypothetical protein
MKKIILVLFIYLLSDESNAQRLNIDWEATPTIHIIKNELFLKESAIVIKEVNQYEVSKDLSDQLIYTHRIHKIIRANDEKGIEMFNKIKIGNSENSPIILIKARTISPSGKVMELEANAFKDVKEDNGYSTKIFALEGVEKGSEIEFVVYKRQQFMPFGTEYLQDVVPVLENWFEIVSDKNLIFDIKGYNGAVVEKDTTINNKNSFLAYAKNKVGLKEEKYASYVSHFARVEYSLAYNLEEKKRGDRLFDWDDYFSLVYRQNTSFSDKDIKAGIKLLDNQDYRNCKLIIEKINWIENFSKTSFQQQDVVQSKDADEISFIIKNKLTDEKGMTKLFSLLFTVSQINFQIGYTTNRFIKTFDTEFINPDNLTSCIFYFPDIKQYLAPNEPFYRMPYIPSTWYDNNCLFTKDSMNIIRAEKRMIAHSDVKLNYTNHDVHVFFNTELDTATIQIKNTFQGQNMVEILPGFILFENEKRDEIAKEMLRISEKDEKINNFKYENNDFKYLTMEDNPLKISAIIYATNQIEKAGNKYLFKIGELIGRQAEMYQENERQFDIEIPNPHQYTRNIEIDIPAGYKVNNLDKLNMHVVATYQGRETCKFVSKYTLKDTKLEVNVFEVYNESQTSKSVYEDYRKVINAAADFNKIVIILEKL